MAEAPFQLYNPELEGEVYYLTEQEGGRWNPITSGYRGQFYYNGRDWDAPQILIDKEICYPGETAKISLQMLSPNFHVGQFYVGQGFEIREGTTTVGRGKITQILRNDFKYWDFDTFFSKLSKEHQPSNFQYVKTTKFLTGDQVLADERPCQHRDHQRAGVVKDRKAVERCNGLDTKSCNFSI